MGRSVRRRQRAQCRPPQSAIRRSTYAHVVDISSRGAIIVTGSTGLIGSVICPRLRNIGYEVLELDLSLGDDLNDESFVEEYFRDHKAEALVNLFARNHHVSEGVPVLGFLDVSLESFDDFLRTNVTSLFSVCREYIRNNKTGSIVNLSSIYGLRSPRPDLYGTGHKHPGYGASKAAVISLTQFLARHAAPDFSINCVVLGGIVDRQSGDFVTRYTEQVPMGRMATPDDLLPVIEMLIRTDSKYISGSTILVDGGLTA